MARVAVPPLGSIVSLPTTVRAAGRLAATLGTEATAHPPARYHVRSTFRSSGGPNKYPPPPPEESANSVFTTIHSPGLGRLEGAAATRVAKSTSWVALPARP